MLAAGSLKPTARSQNQGTTKSTCEHIPQLAAPRWLHCRVLHGFAIARIATSSYPPTPHPQTLFWYQCSALVALGSTLLLLLGVAVWLLPDPRGIGTHKQLGLPPCSVPQIYGIRGRY